jgi:NitT/TauT family transport system ATP-binding protein
VLNRLLEGFEGKYPRELSGGMQMRAGICRALVHDPDILLMDEPFSALDALTREELTLELMRIWREQPKTVLFVTHDVDEALLLSDKVAVMTPSPGKIKEVLDVPFPRPRCRPELAMSPGYLALRSKLLACLYEEMLGDIAKQEKEMRRLR